VSLPTLQLDASVRALLERAALVTKERRGREQLVHANRATLGRAAALLASCFAVGIIAVMFLPETRGKPLPA